MAIVEPAPAKLNLALHVRRRREDGYHELDTLFAFARDGDTITIEPAAEDSFAITGEFAHQLNGDGDNLVLRARDAFRSAFGVRAPVAITLHKQLPVASGIGGGSADAAATLRALARLHDVVGDPRLMTCAAELGSDVPACLLGRTSRGSGRGEELATTAGDVEGTPVLLVNPGVGVSTAAVFARWDGIDRGAVADDDVLAAARAGRNDLQAPALTLAPVIADVLSLLSQQAGVTLVRMSGSGATCFALFSTVEARRAASEVVRTAQPTWWQLESELST